MTERDAAPEGEVLDLARRPTVRAFCFATAMPSPPAMPWFADSTQAAMWSESVGSSLVRYFDAW